LFTDFLGYIYKTMAVSNTNKGLQQIRKSKTLSDTTQAMVFGKVPPQAREMEAAVLGAVLLERGAFDIASELLKPECFYEDKHQKIYAACIALQQKNEPIDLLTVIEELRKRSELEIVGGAYYLSKLTNNIVSSANLETHARIVLQKFIQREMIRISGETITTAYEDSTDVFDLMDDAEGKLFEITKNYLRRDVQDMPSVLKAALDRIEFLRTTTEEITGVPSGFRGLDKVTNGFQNTDLIIIAARPAVGKTAFVLNIARNAALNPTRPIPVGFFSLEMSASQLVQRILSAQSGIKMEKLSRGKLEDHEVVELHKNGVDPLMKANIFIDDTAALNIFELRAKCRRMVAQKGVGIIIIDYLQLMSGTGDKGSNREQEISTISRNLKTLAKELNVPIIALSQLSRAVETRGANKEGQKLPQLSDLRESGAIEQDADMVMFIYRPEYYEQKTNAMGEDISNLTEIKIAKHRNGSLETIKLQSDLSIQKFTDWDDDTANFGKPFGFTPIDLGGGDQRSDASLYISKSSRMNEDGADTNEFTDFGF
jgi:replicative DNA helicase